MQDFIVGPYDQIIKTANFPVLASIVGLAYEGGTPFQAEVYFINLAQIIQVKFGVPFFDVYDPRCEDFGVPVAVRGTISFRINDYREFVKLHRLNSFNLEDFQHQIRDAVTRYVKDTVANAPALQCVRIVAPLGIISAPLSPILMLISTSSFSSCFVYSNIFTPSECAVHKITPRASATAIAVVVFVLKNNSSTAISSGLYLFMIVSKSFFIIKSLASTSVCAGVVIAPYAIGRV